MKRFLSLALMLIMLSSFFAGNYIQAYADNDFSYIIADNEDGVTIVSVSGKLPESLTIPSKLNGKAVTEIGVNAFSDMIKGVDMSEFESVVIPDSVRYIGWGAFDGCPIKSVKLPDKLEIIDGWAFRYTNLSSVSIPETVSYIGSRAFWTDTLEDVTIPNTVKGICGLAFSCPWLDRQNDEFLIVGDGVLLKSTKNTAELTIPSGVKEIAFDGNGLDKVKVIKVPYGVEKINDVGIYNFEKLEKIILPESLKYIGESSFEYCNKLRTIDIPASVKEIGQGAFNFTQIETVNYAGTKEQWSSVKVTPIEPGKPDVFIASNPTINFAAAANSNQIIVPGNKTQTSAGTADGFKTEANDNGFTITGYDGKAPRDLVIPSKIGSVRVTEIAPEAFYKCKDIVNVTISEGIEKIGWNAFYGCDNMKSVELPDSLLELGDGVFCSCTRLEAVDIPEGILTINRHMFKDCKYLETVFIPGSVTTIGDAAFYGCKSIENVYFGGSVKDWSRVTIKVDNVSLTKNDIICLG